MHEAIAAPLEVWGGFYVIVGSSAGALTGLQFVVMTLIAQTEFARGRGDSIAAFGTPNVVHFCAALLVSAILSVPWDTLRPAGLILAACGVAGVVYSVIVIRRAQRQQEYAPVFEDWLWHTILPVLSYATLFVAGLTLVRAPAEALLAIGATALVLVFIGIHNAWDTVTYVTMRARAGFATGEDNPGPEARVVGAEPVVKAVAVPPSPRGSEPAPGPPPAATGTGNPPAPR